MISIDHVTKRYGATTVVDDVSCSLPGGGVTSIIGPNGAGKSTLLSMMSRLLLPDAGRIEVAGLDVVTTPGQKLAKTLSILRQENQLTIRLSVRDLVGFGRFPHNNGRPTPEDRDHIERSLDYLDLTDLGERFVDELSGGQRQRAFIAMVLAQDTDYILLDEPLNNLDMRHSVDMMRLLRRLADDLGKTVVLVIHDVNFASCYSDEILAMREGALIHQGTPEQIMTPEVLYDIYDVDIQVEQIRGNRIGVYFA